MDVLKQFKLIHLYIYVYIGFVLRALGPLEPCSASAEEFVEMQNLRPYPKPRKPRPAFLTGSPSDARVHPGLGNTSLGNIILLVSF